MSHAEETRVQLPELKTEELIAGNGLRKFLQRLSLKRLGYYRLEDLPSRWLAACGVDQQK